MLSAYEKERLRNIADNQRKLAALGLIQPIAAEAAAPSGATTNSACVRVRLNGAPCIATAGDARRVHWQRIVYVKDEKRVASLRARAPPASQLTPRKAALEISKRKIAAAVAIVAATAHARAATAFARTRRAMIRAARKGSATGRGAGGWNAGPYIGVALVQEMQRSGNSPTLKIAIRERTDGSGRLYGYVGRTQIACKPDKLDCLPVVISGIKVLSYKRGERM